MLTRKIAAKRDLKTNGCGYPKEVKIALKLQKIFGEEVLNKIAFINDEYEIFTYLEKVLGTDEAWLYLDVSQEMQKEFGRKYALEFNFYNGFTGIMRKILNYYDIDYTKVNEIIDKYKESHYDDNNSRKK